VEVAITTLFEVEEDAEAEGVMEEEGGREVVEDCERVALDAESELEAEGTPVGLPKPGIVMLRPPMGLVGVAEVPAVLLAPPAPTAVPVPVAEAPPAGSVPPGGVFGSVGSFGSFALGSAPTPIRGTLGVGTPARFLIIRAWLAIPEFASTGAKMVQSVARRARV